MTDPQCKCPIGGACVDGGPHCYAQGIGGPGFAIKPLPNCAVECEALCQMSVRGYCERPRSPQGWSDSGPVEGA